jgi:acyl-CoA synthetase (NDP forming)
MMTALDCLFSPRSVAVLGVSRDPAKLGYHLLKNVKNYGYGGALYPVHPSGDPILGCPTVREIEALPDGVDLALVSLPAAAVPSAIEALASRRVRAAVVLSSGFGEVDEAGRSRQGDVGARARAGGLRLVGPNCIGVYSAPARLNGTYFGNLPRALLRARATQAGPPGADAISESQGDAETASGAGVGVVSQSGAYGGLIMHHLGARGLGVARFLSIGNQADVELSEVVEYLAADAATTVIACFIEGVRDGRRLVEAAARATARKPVVFLKGGRSDAGRRAAGSHTGALAGTYEVYRAACRRAGVVLADETEEFFDAIEVLAVAGDRPPRDGSVAVITVSGGPSVIAADTAERSGLRVPPLGDDTRRALRTLLPSFAALGNPVDLTPQVERARIAPAVKLVFDDPSIGGAIAINVGLDHPEFADGILAASRATAKPVVAFTADTPEITARFQAGGVPVLPSPERAVRAWRALASARRAELPRTVSGRELPVELADALRFTRGALPYAESRRVLEAYGVRFCRETIASTAEEAVAAARSIGFPVVVKADAPGLLHRTESGGVQADVRDPAGVREACRHLRAKAGAQRFLVQERVGPGVELLLGARRDPIFGPVVVVGTGGILTEVIQDVSVRLAPVVNAEVEEMLGEGVRARLLAGPRGLPAAASPPLVDAIRSVSDLICSEPRVVEIDVNPVIVAGRVAVAVDALVVLVGEAPVRGMHE